MENLKLETRNQKNMKQFNKKEQFNPPTPQEISNCIFKGYRDKTKKHKKNISWKKKQTLE